MSSIFRTPRVLKSYLLIDGWTHAGFVSGHCRKIDTSLPFLWRSSPQWSPQRSLLWLQFDDMKRKYPEDHGWKGNGIFSFSSNKLSFQHLAFSLHRLKPGASSVSGTEETSQTLQTVHDILSNYVTNILTSSSSCLYISWMHKSGHHKPKGSCPIDEHSVSIF